jgi:hypothetical protein
MPSALRSPAPGWPACWPTAATRCWKSAALTAACAATAASPTRSTPKPPPAPCWPAPRSASPSRPAASPPRYDNCAARQAAVKARTQATNQLRALLLDAPEPLRALRAQPNSAHLAAQLARLRPATTTAPADLLKHTLRSIARRWLALDQEVSDLDQLIGPLVRTTALRLLARPGVGPDAAATLLIAAGDNPDRLHSEASFAALCGVSPLPASSGKIRRHRLNRGGDRQANRALHMVVHVACSTIHAPAPTSNDAPSKACPDARSYAASSTTWPANYSTCYHDHKLTRHRSVHSLLLDP